jgi:putative oxidoreductase
MDAATKNLALLVGRIFIAGLFIWDATVMLRFPEATVAYMENFGLPGMLWPLAAAFQLVGGVLIVIGLMTQPTALAFAGFTIITAVIFHRDFGDGSEILHFGKDFAMAGGFLFLFASGAGSLSFDAWRGRR